MSGLDLLYGRNAVLEVLRAGRRRIYRIFLAAGVQQRGTVSEIITLASQADIPVQPIERASMDKMMPGTIHHGVMAEATPYPYVSLPDIHDAIEKKDSPALLLVLDYIQDPQNLGTLLRTAEALAVDGIIIPEHRAAGITPAVVNASAGATEHARIARATNLVRAMKDLQAHGIWMIGLEKVENAPLHVQMDLTGPLGLVVGSEGKGMSRLVRETCDTFMQLPMLGRVNSLNAAVAGSVALYEVWRQRASRQQNPFWQKA